MARLPAMAAVIVLAIVATGSPMVAEAQSNFYWLLSGKEYTINNTTPIDGTPACPEALPNTISFYPSSGKTPLPSGTVKIVGEFLAANIGVCDTGGYYNYPVPSTITISYEVDGDWLLFRFPLHYRVASAVKLVIEKKNVLTAVGADNPFYASILTAVGNAP